LIALIVFTSCGDGKKHVVSNQNARPVVSSDGTKITFRDTTNLTFIKSQKISASSVTSGTSFPARIAATSVKSQEGADRNIVLFEDPALTSSYTQLIHHLITARQISDVNVKQKTIELERAKDLAAHGAATAKDVLEAETALAAERTNLGNERASLIEHEAELKQAGFDPTELVNAKLGTCWIICEVPESMISSVNPNDKCQVAFQSFPEEKFEGSVEAVGDVIDRNTRMVKVRVAIKKLDSRLRAGMFGGISFAKAASNVVTVSKQSIITVQGKSYVFVRTKPLEFERKEINIASLTGDRAVVTSGVAATDDVVTEGAMQLKGLSFGY